MTEKRVIVYPDGTSLYYRLELQYKTDQGIWVDVPGYQFYPAHANKLVSSIDFLLAQVR